MIQDKLKAINTKLDALALQKRLEIEDEHLKRIKCTRFVRLFGTFTGSSFKVNTRILNEISNEEKTSFWDIVKRFCICVNTNYVSMEEIAENLPEETTLSNIDDSTNLPQIFEWTKDSQTDGFIIPINSDCKKIQIMIKLSNQRNIFKLNNGLARIFNKYSDTKHNIIKDMYKYVNANKLNNYVSSNITCDPNLESLLKVSDFNFNNVANILDPYFEPISYCCIDVKIGKPEIWDIEVEIDDLIQMPVLYPNVVQNLEKKIEDTRALKKKIQDRIEVLDEFCENPSLFINRKIAAGSEGMGIKTVFYEDLNVQSGLFELIKRKDQ